MLEAILTENKLMTLSGVPGAIKQEPDPENSDLAGDHQEFNSNGRCKTKTEPEQRRLSKDLKIHIEPLRINFCDICERLLPNANSLRSHLLAHHAVIPNGSEMADVLYTDLTASGLCISPENALNVSMAIQFLKKDSRIPPPQNPNQKYSEDNLHKCLTCGMTFPDKLSLILHFQKHVTIHEVKTNSLTESNDKVTPFKCPVCQKYLVAKNNLKIHMRTHTKDRPYACTYCPKRFTQIGARKIHELRHTGEKPHECHDCLKRFVAYGALVLHQRTHSGERPFSCDFCSKTFADPSAYARHLRIHTGDKRYECQRCNKSFTDLSALIVHKTIHTGETPFKCPTCGKAYRSKSNLTCHLRSHSESAQYKCMTCGKIFYEKHNFKQHCLLHGSEKPYQCSECDKRFKVKSYIWEHIKRHHAEGLPYKCGKCKYTFKKKAHFHLHVRTRCKYSKN